MKWEAQYDIVDYEYKSKSPLTLRDRGPWTVYPTITNDVENVVKRLIKGKFLSDGQRLFYYDSVGNLDEIIVRNGSFVRFASISKEEYEEAKRGN